MKWIAAALVVVGLTLTLLYHRTTEQGDSPDTFTRPLVQIEKKSEKPKNQSLIKSPPVIPNLGPQKAKLADSRNVEITDDEIKRRALIRETKETILFLNKQKTENVNELSKKSKSWRDVPYIKNSQKLAILVCGAGDVKFKKGITKKNWRIILSANYRGDLDQQENFATLAILEDGELKTFHSTDEPGIFLADPDDLTHFIIRASKIVYLQVFSTEKGPNDDVNYKYAANVYVLDESDRSKGFQRMGIVLMPYCKDEDVPWGGVSGRYPITDKLKFVRTKGFTPQ